MDISAALERYRLTEPTIQAWVEVNPQPPLGDGPLSNGIPFGVKDIFETTGLATEYGSEIYKGRRGTTDAALVKTLRQLGAVLFGKTRTTAFASFDPAPTRNPRNPAHTPGGSSSGSAAAVAAGVVPFALGSQTMGSVIRPASFCGIVGFKPSFGVLPTDGVLPFAPSLDTVGFLADSVATCVKVWQALGLERQEHTPLRFAVVEDLLDVSEEMKSTFAHAVERLGRTYSLGTVTLPRSYAELLQAARTINDYEGARSHFDRWREFGDRIGVKLAQVIQHGLETPEAEYQRCLQLLRQTESSMARIFEEFPILLTPAVLGIAPQGLASTGDPVMNAVWTALHTPAITIPMPNPSTMPLGLQMIGELNHDSALLHTASLIHSEWCGSVC